jgi:hypothetical protein
MTTYQDPPPHSRRAVRQSERDESAAKSGQSAPVQPTPYIFDAPGAPATGASAMVPQRILPHRRRYSTPGAAFSCHPDRRLTTINQASSP